jgi:ElaB/YqjD/DUF883 family membrane-anchored ribosome-binding protein
MSTTAKKDHGSQAKEAAGQAADKAQDAVSKTGEAISHAASAAGQAIGQTAESATAAVGSGIQNLAGTVRDSGPREGMLGTATRTVADSLEGAGKYLEDKNLSGMMDDINGLIKRNPVPAVLLALGIGFLVGRALSSRS